MHPRGNGPVLSVLDSFLCALFAAGAQGSVWWQKQPFVHLHTDFPALPTEMALGLFLGPNIPAW